MTSQARVLDQLVADMLRPMALPCLRIVLGLIFVWFGGLKVAGVSPVEAMVAGTIPWANPNLVVPVLAAHLAGTFLTFVMLPGRMFQAADPLLLTADGEFVMKNLVLLSATLVLIVHSRASSAPGSEPGSEPGSAPGVPT